MNRNISDFALRLIFQDWGIVPVSITGLGIGGSIVGHVGIESWTIVHTLVLMLGMVLVTVVAKCISFAYKLYMQQSPKLKANRFVAGDGLNKGNTILVFSFSNGFTKGQLVTLFCESSGAKQPILIAEITAVYEKEIQAVPIIETSEQEIRKYFEEEARRKMLFATASVVSENLAAQSIGASHE